MDAEVEIPVAFQEDIETAVALLREAGCTEVFLFGSLAKGKSHGGSDLDLAVRGCPPEDFYHILGALMFTLDRPVDLVLLDSSDPFARYLEEKGRLVRVG